MTQQMKASSNTIGCTLGGFGDHIHARKKGPCPQGLGGLVPFIPYFTKCDRRFAAAGQQFHSCPQWQQRSTKCRTCSPNDLSVVKARGAKISEGEGCSGCFTTSQPRARCVGAWRVPFPHGHPVRSPPMPTDVICFKFKICVAIKHIQWLKYKIGGGGSQSISWPLRDLADISRCIVDVNWAPDLSIVKFLGPGSQIRQDLAFRYLTSEYYTE